MRITSVRTSATVWSAATLGVVALGVVLRIPGMLGELWLDELLSWQRVHTLHSWWAVLTTLHTDNNHPLVSLWMYWCEPMARASVVRLPAFVCGCAAIGAAAAVNRSRGPEASFAAASLFAVSYPLVYYSSEARGYAPAVFFVLVAWWALERYLDEQRLRLAAMFWGASILGFLSHPTFIEFLIGAAFWFDVRAQRTLGSVRTATRATVLAFAPPFAAMVVLYALGVRVTTIAGGPAASSLDTLVRALSAFAGGPLGGSWAFPVAAVAAVVVLTGVWSAWSLGDDRWVLYTATPFVALLLAVGTTHPPLYVRYLIVPGTVLMMAVADRLGRTAKHGGLRQGLLVALCLALISGGTGVHLVELARVGRGQFDALVLRLSDRSTALTTVASVPVYTEFDDRNALLFEYFTNRLGLTARAQYIRESAYPADGTDWLVRERLDEPIPPAVEDRYGNHFAIDSVYTSNPLVGLTWVLYRNVQKAQRP